MSWQEQIFTSFIKGIGKTTGTLLTLGTVTGLWYLVTTQKTTKKSKKKEAKSVKIIDMDKMEDIEELDDIQSTKDVIVSNDNLQDDSRRFQKIFDKL